MTGNGICFLGYPNEEVSQSMARLHAEMLLSGQPLVFARMEELPRALDNGDLEAVVGLLNAAFGSISCENHPVRSEAACRMVVQILLIGASLMPAVEVQNALDRSDLEVTAGNRHWVFEFKFLPEDGTPPAADRLLTEAVRQMRERHCGEASLSGKELRRAALVYSGRERRIVRWSGCDPDGTV